VSLLSANLAVKMQPRQAHESKSRAPQLAVLSDEELLKLFRSRRDGDTARVLIERLYPVIRTKCELLLRGVRRTLMIDTDDVVQQVMASLLQAITRPKPVSNVDSWLTVLAKNHIHEAVRRSKSRDLHYSQPDRVERGALIVEDYTTSSVTPLQDSAVLKKMEIALKELNPDDRHLILALYSEGLTASQVAKRLALTPRTVRSRLSRIMQILRSKVRASDYDDDKK